MEELRWSIDEQKYDEVVKKFNATVNQITEAVVLPEQMQRGV